MNAPIPIHIIVSHSDGADYEGRAVVGAFNNEADARDEAKKLQIATQSIRYSVFALVGTSEPEPGARFVRVKA